MRLFGNGRVALVGDAATAERLGWAARRRSRPDAAVLLRPRGGDAHTEPWIAPGWHDPAAGPESLRRRSTRTCWSYLPEPPGVLRYLRRLAEPASRRGASVAVVGMGRVGGVAATVLALTPSLSSGIREVLVHDCTPANQQRWLLELGSIARWRSGDGLPAVGAATIDEVFARCDVVLFAAAAAVPPPGAPGDVRTVQFAPNRAILVLLLERARAAGFTGLLIVVSDPVDALAQAAFHDSNSDASGAFTGQGLAPERVGGLGLGVMWGRALACARQEGWEKEVSRRGALYGPHGSDVLAYDDVRRPDRRRCLALTRAAREGNLRVRALGHLPYVGPGASSVGLMLPQLLAGEEVLASVMLDGVYFGAPARMDWGLYPTPHPMARRVWSDLRELRGRLEENARSLGLTWRPG